MKKNKFKLPFFIAEISANHCGNFNLAKKLIKCAKDNGADAVKLQTYTADTMTIKSDKKYFKIKDGLWKGYQLWDLYNKAHTPLVWHSKLFKYAKSIGIKIFSTPFDETAVDFLEKLNCPIYKIASFEMTDIPLIAKIASTKKPLIISTGMATLDEIELTFNTAKKYGSKDITLLYCVSNYPSKNSDFNLNNIKILKDKFKCRVGFSDHSKNNKIALAAIASGAEVIEKHIALGNQKKGLDINFSLKGKEIGVFRQIIDEAYNLLGKKRFYRNKSEDKSKVFRRSIFAIKDIRKGEKFTKNNIKRIRPGYGLPPLYYKRLLNKKSLINIKKGTPLKFNNFK
ncbi:MAG: pseudaminic acid synthase [Candidatus Pelagibacter sp. TMED64]|nr:pseudaminic acid synthase [Candidatus Pelagibacter sp.]OUU66349.1 MAG: pseudaminic acid synthase [Candidatus Pelagibacter sp. TMED64]|tara:strand:- start:6974 stop:7996 length:1023 start_codon:yes stop_codon:yes gene_type:complete